MRATSVLVSALLALLVAATLPGVPLPVRVVLAVFLCVAAVLEFADRYDVLAGIGAACAATLAVVLVALQYGAVPEGTAGPFAWGIAVVLVAYAGVVSRDWSFTAAFGLFVAVVAHHASTLPLASGRFSFIVTGIISMGLCVFVLPRYVPREAFYWIVAVASAALVAVGSLAYVADGYGLLGITVHLWSSDVAVLGVQTGVPVLRSVFANPNTFGLVTFAGTVAAVAGAHRAVARVRAGRTTHRTDGRSRLSSALPVVVGGLLFLVNAAGLFLSNSRASYVAAAVALVLYAVVFLAGRRALAPTTAVLAVAVVGLLGTMALGFTPISASGRFSLWFGALQATADGNWLLGAGIVSPAEVIEPYVAGPAAGHSTHNSYLSVLVRFGTLGGAAYLTVVVGSVLAGVSRADLPGVAFALAVVVHHLFEAYTLLNYGILGVLAGLVVGYALRMDPSDAEASDRPTAADSPSMAPL